MRGATGVEDARLSTGYGGEAIQDLSGALRPLDRVASLAMTARREKPNVLSHP